MSVLLAAAHNSVDAPLDVGHLLQHLVDRGLVALQTHVLRVLVEEERRGGSDAKINAKELIHLGQFPCALWNNPTLHTI